MELTQYIAENFGLSARSVKIVNDAEIKVEQIFKKFENISQINQIKVMKAFSDYHVSERHFMPTSGMDMMMTEEILLIKYMLRFLVPKMPL